MAGRSRLPPTWSTNSTRSGKQLRVVKYTDYTAVKVRTLFPNAAELAEEMGRSCLPQRDHRALAERGIEFDELADAARQPDADPFDLLCHVAFNAPLRTRRERADRLKKDRKDFFDKYAPEARCILEELLGEIRASTARRSSSSRRSWKCRRSPSTATSWKSPSKFGGVDKLREAIAELQTLLYAAA